MLPANKQAQEVALRHFGNKIYIRGLIEVSNCCRNNCYYCGIRKGNPKMCIRDRFTTVV